jgi:hypothetical protein
MASIAEVSGPVERAIRSYRHELHVEEAKMIWGEYLQTGGAQMEKNLHRDTVVLQLLLEQYGAEQCAKFLDLCKGDLKLGMFVFWKRHGWSSGQRFPEAGMQDALMILESIMVWRIQADEKSSTVIDAIEDMLVALPVQLQRAVRQRIHEYLAEELTFERAAMSSSVANHARSTLRR